MRAYWNDVLIAESDETIVVENNHYFPPGSVNPLYLRPSPTRSHCPWKGKACYHSIEVNGDVNKDAAWYYPEPKPAAENIKGYIAFWKGVRISQ